MRLAPPLYSAFLLALATGAGAQTYPQPDSMQPSTVQVTAQARIFRLDDDQARTLAGAYALSNGWRLQVRPAAEFIDVTLNKRRHLRLVAVTADEFVSRDGSVSMEFNRGPEGDDMVMRYRPDPRLAQVVVLSSALAQR